MPIAAGIRDRRHERGLATAPARRVVDQRGGRRTREDARRQAREETAYQQQWQPRGGQEAHGAECGGREGGEQHASAADLVRQPAEQNQ
jgi:hypothetical protein